MRCTWRIPKRWALTVGAAVVLLACVSNPANGQVVRRAGNIGMRVIEVYDPATGDRVRRVAEDLTPSEISAVQRALGSQGYRVSTATGTLNPETRNALTEFQSERGLVICGCISYETVLALGLKPQVSQTIVGRTSGVSGLNRNRSLVDVVYAIPVPVPVLPPRLPGEPDIPEPPNGPDGPAPPVGSGGQPPTRGLGFTTGVPLLPPPAIAPLSPLTSPRAAYGRIIGYSVIGH